MTYDVSSEIYVFFVQYFEIVAYWLENMTRLLLVRALAVFDACPCTYCAALRCVSTDRIQHIFPLQA